MLPRQPLALLFTAFSSSSKIVVTTRSKNVASIMDAVYTHDLGGLCFEDCWSLFKNIAFKNRDSTSYLQLESTGRKIVDKCQGLPLAVKAVGTLLRSKTDERDWNTILKNEIWDFKPHDGVLPSLLLSYHHLPLHLKRCFAYCSIFPKDHEFDKEKLILLWMAEGLLEMKQRNQRMEEVGGQYFNELVAMSFFQKSVTKESGFVMHDLIHDLAQHISGEFCIRLEDDKVQEVSDKARHLLYFRSSQGSNLVGFKRYEPVTKAKYLRTFLGLTGSYGHHVLSKRVLQDKVPKMRCLHVLSLSESNLTSLPDSISDLKHLRYLDLSFTRIKKLPESICCLYNLQIMILSYCWFLTELPSRMGNLISLHYLDIRGAIALREMPSETLRLKRLQRLSNFILGPKSGSRIGDLRELSDIGGQLHISGMHNVVCVKDALEAIMKDKRYLDELVLQLISIMTDDVQNGASYDLLSIFQPHPNLKRLQITGYSGATFPDWVGDPSFSNLMSLQLSDCQNCSSLPPLGQLPSLEHLLISGMNGIKSVGSEFYGNGFSAVKPSFPSLQTLTFQFMRNWEKWLCCGELPNLQELHVTYCWKLSGKLPEQLPSLKKLEISGCPNLLVASLACPAISELKMMGYGKLQLKRPSTSALKTSQISISNLSQWKQLPVEPRVLSITKCESVESLLEEGILQTNTRLVQDLSILGCCFSKALSKIGLPNALKRLQINGCTKLEFLLPELFKCHHPFLQHLRIRRGICGESLSITFWLTSFPRLTSLYISEVKGLEYLSALTSEEEGEGEGEGDTTSTDRLWISKCPNLGYIELPAIEYVIQDCFKLKLLKLTNSSMQSLRLRGCPDLMFHMNGLPANLQKLEIENCGQLTPQVDWGLQRAASLTQFMISGGCEVVESFPQECLLPSTLTSLKMWHLLNLKSLDSKGLQRLSSLQLLSMSNCPRLESLTGSGLQHLLSLKSLRIWSCSELQSLTEAGLQHLTSLEDLQIQDCPKLQYLTKQRLPHSLSCLIIGKCPLLEKRCQFEKGEDWHYIAHIPHIQINDELF